MVGHAPCVRSHRAVYLVEGHARVVGGAGDGQHARVLRDDGAGGAGAARGRRAGAAVLGGVAGPRAGPAAAAAGAVRGRRAAAGGRARVRAGGRAGVRAARAAAARRAAQGAPPLAQQQARATPALRDRQPDDAAGLALQPTVRCAPDR